MNSDSTKSGPGSHNSNGVIPAAIAVQKQLKSHWESEIAHN